MSPTRLWMIPLATTLALGAQEAVGDPLQNLLSTPITVASRKAMALRNSPGIITLITREEILDSGARDLMDVLGRVPGFYPGFDVTGVVGVGVRGAWAYEGKLLFLLDGMELNESLYGNLPLLGHFPLATIKRIEIIRGPGSVVYGGFAELAVVNIITLDGADLQGQPMAQGALSRMGDRTGRSSLEFAVGDRSSGQSWSLGAFLGRALESDQVYTDPNLNRVDLGEEQNLRNIHLNAGFRQGDTSLRFLIDRYTIRDTNRFGTIGSPKDAGFDSYHLQAAHEFHLGSSASFKLEGSYNWQKPWDTSVTTFVERGGLTGLFACDLPRGSTLQVGFSATEDQARLGANATPADYFQGGTQAKLNMNREAIFAQALLPTPWFDVTLGARYEKAGDSNSALEPRFALTKVFDRLHFKLLWAGAFRSPLLGNFAYNPDLEPERTRTVELEVGLRTGANGILTVNAYQNTIRKMLVYQADPFTGIQSYFNVARLKTEGLELEYHLKADWGFANAGVALVRPEENGISTFQVTDKPSVLVAVPGAQASLLVSLKLGRKWNLSPSCTYLGPRHGYGNGTIPGPTVAKTYPATTLLNCNLRWQADGDASTRWNASLGVFDLLNERPSYLQAYNGGHPGLPGPSREIVLRVGYGF
jgi:outer membrane receptor protein involved in Fe transport